MTGLGTALASQVFWEQLAARWMFLIYLGLSFSITFRAGFVNLGLSGQLVAGAYVACLVASWTHNIAVSVLATWVAVYAFGTLPAYLKYRLGANEVLTTLFITYIAIAVGQYLMRPSGTELLVASPQVPADALPDWLMPFSGVRSISVFHFPAVPVALLAYAYLRHSIMGYELRLVGDNADAVKEDRKFFIICVAMVLTAACLTLALMGDTYAVKGRYTSREYDATGFIGIAVALVAVSLEELPVRLASITGLRSESTNALLTVLFGLLSMPFAALFVAFVEASFRLLSVSYGVPARGALIVFGLSLLLPAILLRKGVS